MTTQEILDTLSAEYENCLTADGFDDAILGVVERACTPTLVCYDYVKCVEILVEKSKGQMTAEEAMEFLDYNTCCAFLGEYTPVFLHNWRNVPA